MDTHVEREILKELRYKGNRVYVEAAKRDGLGNIIDEMYATKNEIDELVHLEVVDELPETGVEHTIYIYDNKFYTYVDETWISSGVDETEIQLKTINGESLLGEGNIEVVADIDTSAFATKEYVAEQITNAEIGGSDVDLSNYATKEYTAERISEIQIPSSTSQLNNDSGFITLDDIPEQETGYKYFTENGLDLNQFLPSGIYEVTNAVNYEIDKDGILKVDSPSENISLQQWETENAISKRKLESSLKNDNFSTNLTIVGQIYSEFDKTVPGSWGVPEENGEINTTYTTDGLIQLQAGGKYTISGTLHGQIEIANLNNNDVKAPTIVILNNVKIKNDSLGSAIRYNFDSKKLNIVLADNSENIIYNFVPDISILDDVQDYGVINSEKNLIISGFGGLAIYSNNRSHGIKAQEVIIGGGAPNVKIVGLNPGHDGIHGSQYVNVQSGNVYIENFHEGIEAANSENDDGKVLITGGELEFNKIVTNLVSSTIKGCITGKSKIIARNNTSENLFDNVCVLNNGPDVEISGFTSEDYDNPTEYFGTSHSIEISSEPNDDDNYTQAEMRYTYDDGQIYLLSLGTLSHTPVIKLSGYFTQPIVYAESMNPCFILSDAYFETTYSAPSILSSNKNANANIEISDKTLNIVINNYQNNETSDNDADAIKAEGNIEITGDGVLFAKAKDGDAIDGDKLEFKSSAAIYAYDSGESGLKGQKIYFGREKDKPKDSSFANIYSFGNGLKNDYSETSITKVPVADIYARNGKMSKASLVEVYGGYFGFVSCNTFRYFTAGSAGIALHDFDKIYYMTENTGKSGTWSEDNNVYVDNKHIENGISDGMKVVPAFEFSAFVKTNGITIGEWKNFYQNEVISGGGLPDDAEDGDILAFEAEKEVESITAGHTYTLKKEYTVSDIPAPLEEDHFVSNYSLKNGQKINSLRFNIDKITEIMAKYIDNYQWNIIIPFEFGYDYTGDDSDTIQTLVDMCEFLTSYFCIFKDGARWNTVDPGKVYVTGDIGAPYGLIINVTDETLQVWDNPNKILEPKSIYIADENVYPNIFKKLDNSNDLIEQVVAEVSTTEYMPNFDELYEQFKQYISIEFYGDDTDGDESFNYYTSSSDHQMYIINDKQVESPFMFGWRADLETVFVQPINDNNEGLAYAYPGYISGYSGWIKFNEEDETMLPYTGSLDITIPENYILYGLDEIHNINFMFEPKEILIEGSGEAKWIKNPVPSYTENDVGKSLVVTKTGGEVKLSVPLKVKKSYTVDEIVTYLGGESAKGYLDEDTTFGVAVNGMGAVLILGEDPQSQYGYLFASVAGVPTDGWYIMDVTSEEPAFIPATPPETITLPLDMDIDEYGNNISSIQDLAFFFDLGEVEIKPEWKELLISIGDSVFTFYDDPDGEYKVCSTNYTSKELYDYLVGEFVNKTFRFPHFQTVGEEYGHLVLGIWSGSHVSSITALLSTDSYGTPCVTFTIWSGSDSLTGFGILPDGSITHDLE